MSGAAANNPSLSATDKILKGGVTFLFSTIAPVAQLDRAPGYEPGGREFESLRAHQSHEKRPALSRPFLMTRVHRCGLIPGREAVEFDYSAARPSWTPERQRRRSRARARDEGRGRQPEQSLRAHHIA
jgi:hypothetical protein